VIYQKQTSKTAAIADLPTGGEIVLPSGVIDQYRLVILSQSTSGQSITLPQPTDVSINLSIDVVNNGSSSFTLYGATVEQNSTTFAAWEGSKWVVAKSGGSGNTKSYNFGDLTNTSFDIDVSADFPPPAQILTQVWDDLGNLEGVDIQVSAANVVKVSGYPNPPGNTKRLIVTSASGGIGTGTGTSTPPHELTQAEAEGATSTVFGTVSGERLLQAINAAAIGQRTLDNAIRDGDAATQAANTVYQGVQDWVNRIRQIIELSDSNAINPGFGAQERFYPLKYTENGINIICYCWLQTGFADANADFATYLAQFQFLDQSHVPNTYIASTAIPSGFLIDFNGHRYRYNAGGVNSAATFDAAQWDDLGAIPGGLPAVTTANNGQTLSVSGGTWTLAAPVDASEVIFHAGAPDANNTTALVWVDTSTTNWPCYTRATTAAVWPATPSGTVFSPPLIVDTDGTGEAVVRNTDDTLAYVTGLRLGYGAGNLNSNVVLGNGALAGANTANSLVAVGFNALNANTTGAGNTAVGIRALMLNTTGANNVAFGGNALRNNVSGSSNMAIGASALVNATGSNSVAVGQGALQNQTSGASNVAIGFGAGQGITTASNNVVIGAYVAAISTNNGIYVADGSGTLAFESNTAATTSGGTARSFKITGDTFRYGALRTIATSTSPGLAGEVCFDSSFIYFAIAANSWRRIPIPTTTW
jgi:hypothetical protein